MSSSNGRPSKHDIVERRKLVKDLYLKGDKIADIARAVNVSYQTAEKDVQFIETYYSKLVMNNPHIAQKQFAKVEKLLDEVRIIKSEYWTIYNDVKEKSLKAKEFAKKIEQAELDLEIAEKSDDMAAIRSARAYLDKLQTSPHTKDCLSLRIDTLKALLERIDKEAKLLSLFNPQALLEGSYVSMDVLTGIMEVFKGIIFDLIPEDKRNYAFKRLQTVDMSSLDTNKVIDADFTPDTEQDIVKPEPEVIKDAVVIEKNNEVKPNDEEIDLDKVEL